MSSQDIYIKTKPDAVSNIGKMVYWDDVGSRHVFLRSGILEEYARRQVCISGNWLSINKLYKFRNFKGSEWE